MNETGAPIMIDTPDDGLTPEQLEVKKFVNSQRAALYETLEKFGENFNNLDEEDLKVAETLIAELIEKAKSAGLIKEPEETVVHSSTWENKEMLE